VAEADHDRNSRVGTPFGHDVLLGKPERAWSGPCRNVSPLREGRREAKQDEYGVPRIMVFFEKLRYRFPRFSNSWIQFAEDPRPEGHVPVERHKGLLWRVKAEDYRPTYRIIYAIRKNISAVITVPVQPGPEQETTREAAKASSLKNSIVSPEFQTNSRFQGQACHIGIYVVSSLTLSSSSSATGRGFVSARLRRRWTARLRLHGSPPNRVQSPVRDR